MNTRRNLLRNSMVALMVTLCLLITSSNLSMAATAVDNKSIMLTAEHYVEEPIYLTAEHDLNAKIVIPKKEVAFVNFTVAKMELLKREAVENQERIARTMIVSNRNLSYNEINEHTNLGYMGTVTADDMNKIIHYWHTRRGINAEFPFENQGQVFIDAAKESGLDPVYIMAHAALESGWGTSKIAKDKHNYFGIAAYDNSAYESSKVMGNDLRGGIIRGANWIARNYYSVGQDTLYTMRYNNGVHQYCTSETWHKKIASIIRTSYKLLQEQ